jgi:hypothetical protein
MLDLTLARLTRWGRWAQGGLRGYPNAAAWLRVALGSEAGEAPDEQEIDRIVCRAQLEQRQVLITQFCHRGSKRQKAQQLGLAKSTYCDRLDIAIWFVHIELDRADKNAHFLSNMPVAMEM